MTVYNGPSLPAGSYSFVFGADINVNGVFDEEQAFYDFVEVTVQ